MPEQKIKIYSASNFTLLVKKFLQTYKNISRPVLAVYPLITTNRTVGTWLLQSIAKEQGVCANLERTMPGEYIWQLCRQMDADLSSRSDFSQDVLVFRILALLDDKGFIKKHPRLDGYLQQCRAEDKTELAKKIATIFDQYQIYHPDWLNNWAENKNKNGKTIDAENSDLEDNDETWQQAIWIHLVETSLHQPRYKIEQRLIKKLETGEHDFNLPKEIVFFGISTLAPNVINFIKAISHQCDIYIFAFASSSTADYQDKNLLSHWRQSEKEFYQQFIKPQLNVNFEFKNAGSELKTKLNFLQQKILGQDPKEIKLDNKHQNISLISCYTPMREVEALYDHLLNLFEEDSSLKTDEILIASPDVSTYAPYLTAVFAQKTKPIPITIVDGQVNESALLNGLQELLQIDQWRFTLQQVMSLLRNRLIQNKFTIDDNQAELIESWLNDAGVRWGIDAKHRKSLGLPENEEHSWRYGLKRLLLGSIMPTALKPDFPIFNEVLPIDNMEGETRLLLSRFNEYCEKLFSWHDILQKKYSIEQWQMHLSCLVKDFFDIDTADEETHKDLLKAIALIKSQAIQANYQKPLNVKSLRVLLNESLADNLSQRQIMGAVNVVSMNLLNGVSYKHICLIGLNYDNWPRRQNIPGFNLMKTQQAENKTNEDRLTQLQFTLAASESLWLSYIGKNINNNNDIPPSVLVSDLLDECRKIDLDIPLIQHPMHAYSPSNFNKDTLLLSHSDFWLKSAKKTGQGKNTIPILSADTPLDVSVDTNISMGDLLLFYRNPQSYFLRHTLGIYIKDETKEWENSEPFDLGNFVDSTVRQIAYQQGTQDNKALTYARASGLLPHSLQGDLLQQKEQSKVDKLLSDDRVKNRHELFKQEQRQINQTIGIGKYQLMVKLDNIYSGGQLIITTDKLNDNKKVELWLQHLVLCCANRQDSYRQDIKAETEIFYLDGEEVKYLKFCPIDNAIDELGKWLDYYKQGQQQVLPFFAKTSTAYAEEYHKNQNREKAINRAKGKWDDDYNYAGQNAKPANQYIYRDNYPFTDPEKESLDDDELCFFETIAQDLLLPLWEHQTEKEEDNSND